MSDQGRYRFEIQIMRRTAAPKWQYERRVAHLGDAVAQCGNLNRGWASGEAVHRVVDVEEGKEKYRRGWIRAWSNLDQPDQRPKGGN